MDLTPAVSRRAANAAASVALVAAAAPASSRWAYGVAAVGVGAVALAAASVFVDRRLHLLLAPLALLAVVMADSADSTAFIVLPLLVFVGVWHQDTALDVAPRWPRSAVVTAAAAGVGSLLLGALETEPPAQGGGGGAGGVARPGADPGNGISETLRDLYAALVEPLTEDDGGIAWWKVLVLLTALVVAAALLVWWYRWWRRRRPAPAADGGDRAIRRLERAGEAATGRRRQPHQGPISYGDEVLAIVGDRRFADAADAVSDHLYHPRSDGSETRAAAQAHAVLDDLESDRPPAIRVARGRRRR